MPPVSKITKVKFFPSAVAKHVVIEVLPRVTRRNKMLMQIKLGSTPGHGFNLHVFVDFPKCAPFILLMQSHSPVIGYSAVSCFLNTLLLCMHACMLCIIQTQTVVEFGQIKRCEEYNWCTRVVYDQCSHE